MTMSYAFKRNAFASFALAALISVAGSGCEQWEYRPCPQQIMEIDPALRLEFGETDELDIYASFTVLWVKEGKYVAPPASLTGQLQWHMGLWSVVGDDHLTTSNFSTGGVTPVTFDRGYASPKLGRGSASRNSLLTCAAADSAPMLYLDGYGYVRATKVVLHGSSRKDILEDREYGPAAMGIELEATFVVSDGSVVERP
jgi:hypothetical protein